MFMSAAIAKRKRRIRFIDDSLKRPIEEPGPSDLDQQKPLECPLKAADRAWRMYLGQLTQPELVLIFRSGMTVGSDGEPYKSLVLAGDFFHWLNSLTPRLRDPLLPVSHERIRKLAKKVYESAHGK